MLTDMVVRLIGLDREGELGDPVKVGAATIRAPQLREVGKLLT